MQLPAQLQFHLRQLNGIASTIYLGGCQLNGIASTIYLGGCQLNGIASTIYLENIN